MKNENINSRAVASRAHEWRETMCFRCGGEGKVRESKRLWKDGCQGKFDVVGSESEVPGMDMYKIRVRFDDEPVQKIDFVNFSVGENSRIFFKRSRYFLPNDIRAANKILVEIPTSDINAVEDSDIGIGIPFSFDMTGSAAAVDEVVAKCGN